MGARIYALMTVLKGMAEIEMLCLNSRENFGDNKRFLHERIYCGVTRTHREGGSTCIKRTLRMRSTDARSKEETDIPIALYSVTA